MTKKEFWNKLDSLVENFDTSEADISMKSMEIVNLLKRAYDANLPIIIACRYDSTHAGTAHHIYVPADPLGMGRIYLFYTTKKKAKEVAAPFEYGEASIRPILDNLFHRKETAGIAFNSHTNGCVIMKQFLDWGFAGENIEKPKDFMDSRPGGWNG